MSVSRNEKRVHVQYKDVLTYIMGQKFVHIFLLNDFSYIFMNINKFSLEERQHYGSRHDQWTQMEYASVK